MTITNYENISLEMIVGSSQLILVVEKMEPFVGHEKVLIIPEGSIFSGKNNPPYYKPPYNGPEFDNNQTEKGKNRCGIAAWTQFRPMI